MKAKHQGRRRRRTPWPPGHIVLRTDGGAYQVQADGSWQELPAPRAAAAHELYRREQAMRSAVQAAILQSLRPRE